MNLAQRRAFLALLVAAFLGSLLALQRGSVLASPPAQLTPFLTPTPGPDGRIIYIVQPNDTLLRISLISGVPLEQLRGLNNLTGDNIIVGQELLLGLGGPSQVSPTPGPSPTPTIAIPTPTSEPGTGSLCILLYEDLNGDSLRQESETSLIGGAISINNRSGSVSVTEPSQPGEEARCFENFAEGEYTISVAIPEGYNPTTQTNYVLRLEQGNIIYLDFGAQANAVTQAEQAAPAGQKQSPLLGILGIAFLLGGLALALFAGRLLKK